MRTVFAVVATIWGGPTYVEFAVRSWRLWKKENFYRPLGSNNRWAFDITHWISVFTIASVTALLVVGSAPHIVWLRVLSLPAPALLFCIGGCIFALTMYSLAGWKAPFRISSTEKGGEVYPGAYYLVEDIVAVNANAGRPFREALAARYRASPRFRRMLRNQSLFWSISALLVSIACLVVVVIHDVDTNVAYGVGKSHFFVHRHSNASMANPVLLGWGVPFVFIGIWTAITYPWVRHDMHEETMTWEEDCGIVPGTRQKEKQMQLEPTESERELPKSPIQGPEP